MDNVTTQQYMLTTSQIWQLLVAFLFPFLIIPIATKIRGKIWLFARFNREKKGGIVTWFKKRAKCLNDNWGIIVLLEILIMFVYISAVFPIILGTAFIMQSIVFGAALVVFMTFQLPRLLKPHINVTFLPPDDEGAKTQLEDLKKPLSTVSLRPGTKHVLNFYISNLGINLYDNWNFIVSSNNDNMKILKATTSPSSASVYEPRGNADMRVAAPSVPFGPDDNIMLSFQVETPKAEGLYQITTEFKCSTRWGETERKLCLYVKDKEQKS